MHKMLKFNFPGFLLLVFLTFSTVAKADNNFYIDLGKGKGEVEFYGLVNPGSWELHGHGPKPTGKMAISNGILTGSVTVALAEFKTGIALRDRHMKEKYLEISQYPTATLEITTMKFPKELLLDDGKAQKIPFTGQLTLHGKKNSIDGLSEMARSGKNISSQATFKIKLSDYGIQKPSFTGVELDNEIRMEVKCEGQLTK
jgi:polyisoprenoid-binding protein YceI